MKKLVTYESKVGKKLQLKGKTKCHQQNNVVYCSKNLVGDTDKMIEEKIINHNKCDKISLKQSCNKNHRHVWENDF